MARDSSVIPKSAIRGTAGTDHYDERRCTTFTRAKRVRFGRLRAIRGSANAISASAILAEVIRVRPGKRILVKGVPRLLGDYYAEQLIDEQFLTLAPQSPGRDAGDRRLSLVMGNVFAPGDPL